MPYQKTKEGRLVNEITLGDGYPLSNDLQPLKVGGEASPIEVSTSLPDDSDNAKVKVTGDLQVTGEINFKNVTGNIGIGITNPTTTLDVEGTVSYKHTAFTTAGPTDNVDVSETTTLEVDTSSNNVVIGGFTGGVQGQILYIVKTNTSNYMQLEHNEGGGSQDIFLTTGADERVEGYGGYTLYCNGTSWFSLSNPTGEADAG